MMNKTDELGKQLEVIQDILLWIDTEGRILDYHPNNHSFLFGPPEQVVGHSLSHVFTEEISAELMKLAREARHLMSMQTGILNLKKHNFRAKFECRVTPLDAERYLAAWRKVNTSEHLHLREFIKGNNRATTILLTSVNQEEAIRQAFPVSGETYRAERIALFRNNADPDNPEVSMSLIAEWSDCDSGIHMEVLQLNRFSYRDDLMDLYNALKTECPVILMTNDLKPRQQEFLVKMGIMSLIMLPVFVRHHFWGFLAMGDCREPRIWSESEVDAIRTIAVVLGSVIRKFQDQEELTLSRLRAEESDRLKSSILANMNHELRTPMTGILGFSEILCEQLEDPSTRQMAENIKISGQRLLATLNSMIELSQFEAKKELFQLKENKLNELILITCEKHIYLAKVKQLGFEIFMSESIYSYIDEKLFVQLLNYILENAVKFTNRGRIIVETSNNWEEDRSWSCISITDTGPGIPEEFHQTIFEEFRQVSEGYNRDYEGSGLGLTLAKKIVELMNGKITLKSSSGQGCTFTIWLPSSQVRSAKQHSRIEKAGTLPDIPYQNEIDESIDLPLILVVEDNLLNAELIRIYLHNICRCDWARDGESAIDKATRIPYETILMDINLGPGIDGLEVARRIRKLPLIAFSKCWFKPS